MMTPFTRLMKIKKSYLKKLKFVIASALISVFLVLSYYFVDSGSMLDEITRLTASPSLLFLIFASYFSAFLVRGLAWKLYLRNRAGLLTCMYGLFYSLLLNHLLPVKAGDLARIGILKAREPGISSHEAINSVVVLRALDTAMLISMAIVGLLFLDMPVNGMLLLTLAAGGTLILIILFYRFRSFIDQHLNIMKEAFGGLQGLMIFGLTLASWILEAGIIYGVVTHGNSGFSFIEAIWVNSITVAGQIFQITPGGIASYEALMIFALRASGIAVEQAYSSAIITHGLKFMFTFLVGGAVLAAYPIPVRVLKKWMKERSNE
jgi:glycosyltransferase AglD